MSAMVSFLALFVPVTTGEYAETPRRVNVSGSPLESEIRLPSVNPAPPNSKMMQCRPSRRNNRARRVASRSVENMTKAPPTPHGAGALSCRGVVVVWCQPTARVWACWVGFQPRDGLGLTMSLRRGARSRRASRRRPVPGRPGRWEHVTVPTGGHGWWVAWDAHRHPRRYLQGCGSTAIEDESGRVRVAGISPGCGGPGKVPNPGTISMVVRPAVDVGEVREPMRRIRRPSGWDPRRECRAILSPSADPTGDRPERHGGRVRCRLVRSRQGDPVPYTRPPMVAGPVGGG